MIKIDDRELMNKYINKYKINDLFSCNIEKYMEFYKWDKNEYICRQGEELSTLLFIVSGKAKVYKDFENGKSLLLSFYKPLKIIGDIEFSKNNIADCSVETIKETYAVGIDFNVVKKRLINDSKFLLNMCSYLSEKLRSNSNNSSINLLYPLENRLASYILAFVNEEDEVKEFIFEGSYSEIADLLGTSYRHLNRTINKLCQEGVIDKNGKSYVVKDIEKLGCLSADLYR